MSKKIWSIEEEKFVCKAYLKELVCCNDYARFVGHEMVEAGFEERSVGSIVAKLNDYRKIHNRLDLSHVATNSVIVYKMMTTLLESDEGLNGFISNTYNPDGSVDDMICFDLNGIPSISKFTVNTKIIQNFDDYFWDLRRKYNKDSEIYNPAGHGERTEIMSRKKFNKVVNGDSRTKENLLMIAILMKLDYPTTQEFLSLCGHTLSNAILSDVIITHAIINKIYDHIDIDITLVKYGCLPLFAVKTRD